MPKKQAELELAAPEIDEADIIMQFALAQLQACDDHLQTLENGQKNEVMILNLARERRELANSYIKLLA